MERTTTTRSSKRAGVCFTPAPLAEHLARETFTTPPAAVLDPACGDGALLEAAWRVGAPLGLRPENLFGIESDRELAAAARRRLQRLLGSRVDAAAQIRTADALHPAEVWPPGTHVLANPPWISFSGRQAGTLEPGKLELYRRVYPSMADWPSLHGAFMERISRHIRANDTCAGILAPASVCELQRYGSLRGAVTAHARLTRPPSHLGEDAFPGVVEPAVLIELEPRGDAGSGSSDPWIAGPKGGGGTERELLRALASFPTLPPACFSDLGVHTGNAARELLGELGAGHAPLREGKDLRPYRLLAPRRGLRVDLERGPERRFRIAVLERYRAVPVLLRQTAKRPIAALHVAPTYFRNTLLACTPPASLDPGCVVAILNGPLISAWHQLNFRDARQRAFPQVKIGHLRSAPFPIEHRAEAPELHDRLAERVRLIARESPPASELSERIKVIEEEVCELYGLPADLVAAARRSAD